MLDANKDLITDDVDICNNSLSYKMRNTYGCEQMLDDTAEIDRYSEFLFEDIRQKDLKDPWSESHFVKDEEKLQQKSKCM